MNVREIARTRVLPVVVVVALSLVITWLSEFLALALGKIFSPGTLEAYPWIFLYFHHFFQMIFAIAVMLVLGGGLKSYGLTFESKNLYIFPAITVGIMFGVIMTLVDFLPTILAGVKISGYDLNPLNVMGWLSFEWVFAGLSEEIFIRGMMMTYLMRKMNGHVRFFKWEVHIAGVIIAVLFALMHISSFFSGNLIYAIGQQIYAFILGLIYAYFYEKSRSLVAPIIAHNVSNGVEFLILFLLIWVGF